jgi:hypothetical protein
MERRLHFVGRKSDALKGPEAIAASRGPVRTQKLRHAVNDAINLDEAWLVS